jgi:hypothetical protein
MEKLARGRTVEKYLYLSVLDLRRLRILGVFYALHGSPDPGACGAVAHVGVTAQTDALLCTLDIRQFCSSTLWILDHRYGKRSAESIDETKDPIKKRGLAAAHHHV